MNAIFYVNTPLEPAEHEALKTMARREGRSKGQQLRLLLREYLARPASAFPAAAGTAALPSAPAASLERSAP